MDFKKLSSRGINESALDSSASPGNEPNALDKAVHVARSGDSSTRKDFLGNVLRRDDVFFRRFAERRDMDVLIGDLVPDHQNVKP